MFCFCVLQYEFSGEPDEEGNPTTRPGKVVHTECDTLCDVNSDSVLLSAE